MSELRKSKYSFADEFDNALDPEQYESGSFGRFATNLLDNVASLAGIGKYADRSGDEAVRNQVFQARGGYVPEYQQKIDQDNFTKYMINQAQVPSIGTVKNIAKSVKPKTIKLYRGLEKEFDPNFNLSKSDAPMGYSTWTDNPDLARQYAGKDGFVYEIELPIDQLGKDYIDELGERPLFFNNQKKAGLNGIKGEEYLLYNQHENYSPEMIRKF